MTIFIYRFTKAVLYPPISTADALFKDRDNTGRDRPPSLRDAFANGEYTEPVTQGLQNAVNRGPLCRPRPAAAGFRCAPTAASGLPTEFFPVGNAEKRMEVTKIFLSGLR